MHSSDVIDILLTLQLTHAHTPLTKISLSYALSDHKIFFFIICVTFDFNLCLLIERDNDNEKEIITIEGFSLSKVQCSSSSECLFLSISIVVEGGMSSAYKIKLNEPICWVDDLLVMPWEYNFLVVLNQFEFFICKLVNPLKTPSRAYKFHFHAIYSIKLFQFNSVSFQRHNHSKSFP